MGFPDCAVVRSGDQYIMGAAVKQTLMLITQGFCRPARRVAPRDSSTAIQRAPSANPTGKSTMTARSIVFVAALVCLLSSLIGKATAEEQTPEQRRMLVEGAHLWSIYCNQCHNARPGSQFSPAQWDAITMHMKTLSNMPAKDMRAIKEFLKLH
jgi:hypothetical protein